MNKIEHYDGEREDGLIFRFTGEIYNRPCGRGICIGESHDYLEEQFPEGNFEAEIIIRRKGSRDSFGVATQPITAPDRPTVGG